METLPIKQTFALTIRKRSNPKFVEITIALQNLTVKETTTSAPLAVSTSVNAAINGVVELFATQIMAVQVNLVLLLHLKT